MLPNPTLSLFLDQLPRLLKDQEGSRPIWTSHMDWRAKNWAIVPQLEGWRCFCRILHTCVGARGSFHWWTWTWLSSWRQHPMRSRKILWGSFWGRRGRISGANFWRKPRGVASRRAELRTNRGESSRGSMAWRAAEALSQKSSFLCLNVKSATFLEKGGNGFVASSAMNGKQHL
jgi:hypothetical protein